MAHKSMNLDDFTHEFIELCFRNVERARRELKKDKVDLEMVDSLLALSEHIYAPFNHSE